MDADQDHHHQDLDLDHGVHSHDLDLDDDHNSSKDESILKTDHQQGRDHCNLQDCENGDLDNDLDLDLDLDDDENDINGGTRFMYEQDQLYCMDNNPPESYAVCQAKVADWLDRNTFIERKTSVKFGCPKALDPAQPRDSHRRSVSLNQKSKLLIIGFRKKPINQNEGKSNSKHNNNDSIRLFRNRSEPGRDYCLLITEPVSPRVSCVGRIGSVRVQGSRRKTGVWRSVKTAFSNLVQTNRVTKVVA